MQIKLSVNKIFGFTQKVCKFECFFFFFFFRGTSFSLLASSSQKTDVFENANILISDFYSRRPIISENVLALHTVSLLGKLVFSTYTLFRTLKYTTEMAEWLWRWTPNQTFVGPSPLTDDCFLCQIFSFLKLQYS